MIRASAPLRLRPLAADLALWTAIGLVMAILGPFGSSARPLLPERLAYWLACMLGGGLIGVAIDGVVRRRVAGFWARAILASVLMTPPVTLLVAMVNHLLGGMPLIPRYIVEPWFQVFIVCFATMVFRQYAWAYSEVRAGGDDAAAESGPPGETLADPLAAFRRRLSARRREAALIAVQAEDHYLRVHTDAGEELVTARFADAVAELAPARGFRTHRSWWVAADAIESVKWTRGRGEARLKSGLVVPISRSQAPALKEAGWF